MGDGPDVYLFESIKTVLCEAVNEKLSQLIFFSLVLKAGVLKPHIFIV